MKLQLLSDLHLETESFEPEPLAGAELLVLAGDIDSTWAGYRRFAGWPVPVLVVAGNHEFDGRELNDTWPRLRGLCAELGFTLLEREQVVLTSAQGQRVRFFGTVRWCDFNLFGEAGRERAQRAGGYFQRVMQATRDGAPFDAAAVRDEALACRAWLERELPLAAARGQAGKGAGGESAAERCVVVTHFAPSLRSADPRYGRQPGTASFCNADDDLLAHADLWLHGHLHCRHDYLVPRPGRTPTRVLCQARGLASRGEDQGFDPLRLIDLG